MFKPGREVFDQGVNIEITNKCKIKCKACPRQLNKKNLIGSSSIDFEDLKVILDSFNSLNFCGQISDPIYYPDFVKMIDYIRPEQKICIHTNGHGFSEEWWTNIFEMSKGKQITWIFGIDGLPKDSHKYRVLQDGEQVWEMMKLGASMGCNIRWQYIVFNYNEYDIDKAKAMAKDHNIMFEELHSNRFHMIPELKPKQEDKYIKGININIAKETENA